VFLCGSRTIPTAFTAATRLVPTLPESTARALAAANAAAAGGEPPIEC
jgi:hypothetical protein